MNLELKIARFRFLLLVGMYVKDSESKRDEVVAAELTDSGHGITVEFTPSWTPDMNIRIEGMLRVNEIKYKREK
jgi:hypothetical protein